MYYSYYGLKDNPFELAPDGSFVYMSETHKEGMATLRYGVIANKGFLLLTGGVGVGKTTILNALLKMLEKKVRVCLLNNPRLTKEEFYHYLANKLDLAHDENKSSFILQFEKLLIQCVQKGEKILLIIDEAQAFPIELLEEIRLLSNLGGGSNVLGIFLVGQPEIREQLATSQLLPLRQRIGIRYHLEPFSAGETEQYIYFRLNHSGGKNTKIFTEEAVATVHEASLGNPRLINILCDHAMLSGFAKDLKVIDKALILESLEELRLPGEATLQTSEVRSPPKPQPSEYIRQPSPESSELVSEPKFQQTEIASEPKLQQVEVVDQTTPKPSEAVNQTELEQTEVVTQTSRQPSEYASQSIPQPSDAANQPKLEQTEVVSQITQQPSEDAGEPIAQSSERVDQLEPERAELVSEATPQPSEDASQSIPKPSEDLNKLRKTGNPAVHFMIALVIMSVIIVVGLMLPAETSHLISGAK